MKSYDELVGDYSHPFIFFPLGDINSRTGEHLKLEDQQKQKLLLEVKSGLEKCILNKDTECINFL